MEIKIIEPKKIKIKGKQYARPFYFFISLKTQIYDIYKVPTSLRTNQ